MINDDNLEEILGDPDSSDKYTDLNIAMETILNQDKDKEGADAWTYVRLDESITISMNGAKDLGGDFLNYVHPRAVILHALYMRLKRTISLIVQNQGAADLDDLLEDALIAFPKEIRISILRLVIREYQWICNKRLNLLNGYDLLSEYGPRREWNSYSAEEKSLMKLPTGCNQDMKLIAKIYKDANEEIMNCQLIIEFLNEISMKEASPKVLSAIGLDPQLESHWLLSNREA